MNEIAVAPEELIGVLGEAIHVALRKGSDDSAAWRAWKAIQDLPGEEWYAVVAFVVDAFGDYGWTVTRPAEPLAPLDGLV